MNKEWRFRVNWRGKIILQREKKYIKMDDYPSYDSYTVTVWEDATAQDMLEFYQQSAT